MTPLQTFAALITNPRRAFAELEKNPRFAIPMILLLAANVGVILWFYASIDVDSFVNQILTARGLNAAQRTLAAGFMTRTMLMGSALIGGILGLVVTQVVQAFCFFFIYEFFDVRRSFRQWFAFTWWCSLPQLISAAATAVMLLFSHSSASVGVLSPFSLNQLFYHFGPEDSGYSLLNSITLVQPLTILLMVIGAHAWSERSWALSVAVVILPRLVLYSAWGWFVFGR
jgi:hypothetical protein